MIQDDIGFSKLNSIKVLKSSLEAIPKNNFGESNSN